MGLLGNSWDDPQSQAVMALAGGLLQGNFGKGATDYGAVLAGAKDKDLHRRLVNAQIGNFESEADTRKAALAQKQSMQDMLKGLLSPNASYAANTASVQPGQAGSGTFDPANPQFNGQRPTQPAGGGLNLSPQQLAMAKLAGLDLSDIAKLSIPQQLGNGWVQGIDGKRELLPDPTKGFTSADGKSVSVMPGFLDANAAITGSTAKATESAKAAFDMVEVPLPDGSKRMMTKAQASEWLGKPAQSGFMNKGGSISPGIQSVIEADAAKNGITNPVANFQGNDWRLTGEKPGAAPAFNYRPAGLGQSQTPAAAGEQKNINEATGKVNDAWLKTSYEPAMAAGQTAQTMIDNSNVARESLKKLGNTGWGTEAKVAGANFLAGLGIAPENAKMFAANAQVFQAKAMDRLWTTLNAAKGPQTEGDAARASQTWAALKNTPQANEYILDFSQAQAERDRAKSAFFKNALPIAQAKGDLAEVEREWDKRMPSIFDMPTMKRWKK